MRIAILETLETTDEQVKRIERLGDVEWFTSLSEEECLDEARKANIVVVDWVDPSPFILDMKKSSLVALMSTGFDWIQHRTEAREQEILISNVPGYATEAVAEHIMAFALCLAKKIAIGDRSLRSGKTSKGGLTGFELQGRTLGIIGLGRIGMRLAQICRAVGMKLVTHNRTPRKISGVKDLPLDELLASSDVVCVSCPASDETRGMLNGDALRLMKSDAVLVGTTWDIVVLQDLIPLLASGQIAGFGFDVAVEGSEISLPTELLTLDNVVLTPHIAFSTREATIRQVDICIANMEHFIQGQPQNIVN